VAAELGVDPQVGLDEAEVGRRRRQYGVNRLRQAKRRSPWRILLDQFTSLVVLLLVVAAGVSFLFQEWVEGFAIAVVIVINGAIGFLTEIRAARSMEALQRMGHVTARVRREGKTEDVPAECLVPGDLALVEAGDIVTADLRIVQASRLQADESALTGESLPVAKTPDPVAEGAPLAERSSMLYKGTAITRGTAEGVVVASGMATELGLISQLVETTEETTTPLERRLDQLGQKLVGVTLAIAVAVIVSGVVAGKDLLLMVETGIALAVATIPEGLPIVATAALARGMLRMARRQALVTRLSAVETLGATNVIFTDKTGTLTENRMTVAAFSLPSGDIQVSAPGDEAESAFWRDGRPVSPGDDPVLRQALEVGVLCTSAPDDLAEPYGREVIIADPLERALLIAGAKGGLHRRSLLASLPEVHEEAFDPGTNMMATYHRQAGGGATGVQEYRVMVKGAPESVLAACSRVLADDGEGELSDADRRRWLARNEEMAAFGLRVIGLAVKNAASVEERPYEGLTFVGLVGLLDPPRRQVPDAIAQCTAAGIRVVMVTGDQAITARNVAESVGLVEAEAGEQGAGPASSSAPAARVILGSEIRDPAELSDEEKERFRRAMLFARVTPKQKLDLIALHQESGAVVAMTGDGVNDAPALKKADIGIAMGLRGTQVAREAADMVLKDDAFETILAAVEQGRVIFANIRRFVVYLLSCNVAEVLTVSLAVLADAPLPLLPLQILFLNLVTDVFPALALGVGEGEPGIMRLPPRDPKEPLLTNRHWLEIALYGLLITAAVLGALAIALGPLGLGTEQAVTVSFLTLAFAQLWHVFNLRSARSGALRNEVTRNPYVWGALALCVLLLLAAARVPLLASVLRVVDPGADGWLLVLGMSLIPLAAGQIAKGFQARRLG